MGYFACSPIPAPGTLDYLISNLISSESVKIGGKSICYIVDYI